MNVLRRACAVLSASTVLAGSALVASPAAHAAPGDNIAPGVSARVVDAWYQDFLGRTARTDPGSSYWELQLDRAVPAEDLVGQITHSEEYNLGRVNLYYQEFLDRSPDPGARYWTTGVNDQRFPLEWVEQNVLASAEFRAGRNDVDVVGLWYDALLGRRANPGEAAYWARRIREVGPLIALREIYYAPETVTARVYNTYDLLLERQPLAGEVNYWSPKEVESDITVQVLIAATAEYRSLALSRPIPFGNDR